MKQISWYTVTVSSAKMCDLCSQSPNLVVFKECDEKHVGSYQNLLIANLNNLENLSAVCNIVEIFSKLPVIWHAYLQKNLRRYSVCCLFDLFDVCEKQLRH